MRWLLLMLAGCSGLAGTLDDVRLTPSTPLPPGAAAPASPAAPRGSRAPRSPGPQTLAGAVWGLGLGPRGATLVARTLSDGALTVEQLGAWSLRTRLVHTTPRGFAVDARGNSAAAVALSERESLLIGVDAAGRERFRTLLHASRYFEMRAIAFDPDGALVVSGHFGGSADLDGEQLGAEGPYCGNFVARFDTRGHRVWAKQFLGDIDTGWGGDVTVDVIGHIVLTGWVTGDSDFGGGRLGVPDDGDLFVAAFDRDGRHLFSRRWDLPSWQGGCSVRTDAERNIVVAGWAGNRFVDFGAGPVQTGRPESRDFGSFLLSLDASGALRWARGIPGLWDGRVTLDPSGGVLLAGTLGTPGLDGFDRLIDFGTGPLPARGGRDAYVAAWARTGEPTWSVRLGDDADQTGGLLVASSDLLLAAGTCDGQLDVAGTQLDCAGGGLSWLAPVVP